ncbi:multidrug effflux MFS transporter [Biostraticola tofi]|uniref:Bcr/CflA family efflux transporter n=1 Tax=Biostraticola tofi TaxID=466109 RepID=A0A4R3Z6Y3_9GAMM|nr:multidrug effflux MFS transporter [Biostraticola tofi]TCV99960.1 DHA1 family bicyclomycin/chloramphenicol resistance-like MFS transporter [Biostraticola tofi]
MRKLLLLLLLLVLLGPLGIDLYLPVIPHIAQGLNTQESLIQSTIPLFILVMGVGQLITGPLVDYFGRRPLALAGVLLYGLGAIMAAVAESSAMFVGSRVLQGMAVCCTTVALFSCVRDRLNGDEAARAFSFLNGTLNIVPALAPLAGGLMAAAFGWRAPFWALAAYAFLVLLLIALGLPETRPTGTRRALGLPLATYWQIVSKRRFLVFSLVNTGAMAMALTYVSLSSQVLMGDAGLSSLQFSFAFGANGFWIMFVSWIANRIIRKAGRPICLTIGTLLMAIGGLLLTASVTMSPLAWQAQWWSYMLPVAAACAGLAFLMGPAASYALEPYANQAGVASALNGFVQMGGAAAISLAFIALPIPPRISLALVMLLGGLFAITARYQVYLISQLSSRRVR